MQLTLHKVVFYFQVLKLYAPETLACNKVVFYLQMFKGYDIYRTRTICYKEDFYMNLQMPKYYIANPTVCRKVVFYLALL